MYTIISTHIFIINSVNGRNSLNIIHTTIINNANKNTLPSSLSLIAPANPTINNIPMTNAIIDPILLKYHSFLKNILL